MADLKGTRTEKNLLSSFAGESQARNRYTFFASVAKKAGFEQIAAIFLETANNEKEHAERFFKFLEGGDVEIIASYPAGVIEDTAANLEASAAGENLEWTKLYKEAEEIAQSEGLIDKMFSKHNTEDVNKDQYLMETKAVWVKLGKDPEEFERLVKENKPIVIKCAVLILCRKLAIVVASLPVASIIRLVALPDSAICCILIPSLS